jgi:DNA-binding transcriptional MerR regulator
MHWIYVFLYYICVSKRLKMLLKNKKMDVHDLLPIIQEKVYRAKDLGVASRTIYHWKTEGLLFDSHNDVEKNMMIRFSLSEYFWIRVIQKCRDFGMSLNQIENVKAKIIDKVRSFDNLEEKYKPLIKGVREMYKGKSEEFIQGKIDSTIKYFNYVEDKGRNDFEEVLFAVLYNRKPSGILIFNNEGKINTDIYIESDDDNKNIRRFYNSHLYVSFDEIFVELGLSDHFKQKELLNDDEKESIKIILWAIRSDDTNKIEIRKRSNILKTIKVGLKDPKSNKETEKYKKRLGSNLEFKTKMFRGQHNLFDFHYTISF